jgi:peptidoglycan/LPS O-acetylase OafA/YrhL
LIDTTLPVQADAQPGRSRRRRKARANPSPAPAPPAPAAPGVAADLSRARLGSLTGMRFFAALPVVLIHVGGGFVRAPWINTANGFGYIGVSFFFLLSGFVLTWSCAAQPARRFWWLRVARVWPAQLLMAVVAMTLLARQEAIPGPIGKGAEILLLQAWSTNQQVYYGGNGVSWSLSAEMFFYLLFPLAVIPLKRLGGRGLAITAAATLAVLAAAPLIASANHMPGYLYSWAFFVFPPYRFGEFLLGMILARAMMRGMRLPAPALLALAATLGLAGEIWGMTWATMGGYAFQRPFVALMVLPMFALLLAAGVTVDLRERRWWLNSWPLLRLGEWSFALYLVHKPTYLLTSRWHWWDNTGGLSALLAFVEFIALAVTVAAALHYLVEKPVAKRLRGVPVGRSRKPALAAQSA